MLKVIFRKTTIPIYCILDTIRYKRGQRMMMAYVLNN